MVVVLVESLVELPRSLVSRLVPRLPGVEDHQVLGRAKCWLGGWARLSLRRSERRSLGPEADGS